jgi:DHA1 family bicyclomycin/chloramphenicol resistance-like MFS transporter
MGLASLASARIVRRLGLPRLLRLATGATLAAGAFAMIVGQVGHGVPPLWLFIASMSLLLPLVTATVPGLNTAAMMPVPQVAGMAAALLGTVSTAGGSLLGAIATGALSDSIAPFGVAALVFTGAAAFCVLVVAQGPRRARDVAPIAALTATGGIATGAIAADVTA